MNNDTIAAIATAVSNSGIGIIRVSGDQSIEIVSKIFKCKNKKKKLEKVASHTIHYGFIIDDNNCNSIIDEVLVSVMKSPNSYTMEDVVEINCHGGAYVMQRILLLLVNKGVRIAEPGEFTKRAFLNGRIDLSKAEAVMDIIQSKNEFSLRSSADQLTGSLHGKIGSLRSKIIHEIAFIESALDDPEHISLDGYPKLLTIIIDNLLEDIERLLQTSENGRLLKEGIKTVILGKPNAGKSSLLNLLVGKERAIVTDIAGTTRDIIEETVMLNGILLQIIDTAGIRNTEDIVEKIGVEKSKEFANHADLILYLVDSSLPLDYNDMEILDIIKDKKSIILFNKIDLERKVSVNELYKLVNNSSIIEISVKENEGIDLFEKVIKKMFFHGDIIYNDEIYITNLRHKEALKEAYESLQQVKVSLENDMPEDFYSIDLMSAYAYLGKIIGEEVEEDLVNEIFSNFCMGK